MDRYKFLIFPLSEAVHLGRGIILEMIPGTKKIYSVTSPPPKQLTRPGISVQKKNNRITDILFLGGNQEKTCYTYNLESNSWSESGTLPQYHIVTD